MIFNSWSEEMVVCPQYDHNCDDGCAHRMPHHKREYCDIKTGLCPECINYIKDDNMNLNRVAE